MTLISLIDYIGTFVFAISGILVGIDKRFDLFGVLSLGLVTAIGGGTLRDLMIGSTPVGWIQNETYLYLVVLAIPLCYYYKNEIMDMRKGFFFFDTLGIGLFTILGLEKALNAGISPIYSIMMGVITAVFGGIIRDVLSNEEPLIFRKEIYASACLIGALLYFFCKQILPESLAMIISILSVIGIRILAVRKKWHLSISVE